MNEIDEIAAAATHMVSAFDKWLNTNGKAQPEADALMEARNTLDIKLNAYNGAFQDLLTDQPNEQ
jgi:hypothetical protein